MKTPGSFTGDTERNGGGWMPDEWSGLVLSLRKQDPARDCVGKACDGGIRT
jgi:hypothetical protein